MRIANINNYFKDIIKRYIIVMHHTDEIVPERYTVSLYKRLTQSGIFDGEERMQIPQVKMVYDKISDHRGYAIYKYGGVENDQ